MGPETLDAARFLTLAAVTLLGAALQSAFGFGFAILAAPIFLGVIDSRAAIQVLVILHVVLSVTVVPRVWASAPRPLLRWMAGGSLVGFPVGLALFLQSDVQTLKLLVGVATVAFSLLLARREWTLTAPVGATATASTAGSVAIGFRRVSAAAVGLVSGLLTAVLVMPGPIAMLYFRALALEKQASRAVSLTFFGFCYVMATGLHVVLAGVSGESWRLAALLAPLVLIGTLTGHALAHRLSEERFRGAVLALLIASGLYSVWAALR